jgi:hypothetical protein
MNLLLVPAVALCAMASMVAPVERTDGAGAASPSPTATVTASERRTLGCGAGAVEVRWTSDEPVRLVVFASNAASGLPRDETPLQTGGHAYVSDVSTLTWGFTGADGRDARPTADAHCVRYR